MFLVYLIDINQIIKKKPGVSTETLFSLSHFVERVKRVKRASPARFDWSIMGWTILLLALINLERMGGGGGEEGEREKEKISYIQTSTSGNTKYNIIKKIKTVFV